MPLQTEIAGRIAQRGATPAAEDLMQEGTVEGPRHNFLGIPEDASRYETSRVVVLPVPFERTTSYGKGTAEGPEAILRASRFDPARARPASSRDARAVAGIRPAEGPRSNPSRMPWGTIHPKTRRKLTAVAPLVKKKLPLSY